MKNAKQQAITDLNAPNGSQDIALVRNLRMMDVAIL